MKNYRAFLMVMVAALAVAAVAQTNNSPAPQMPPFPAFPSIPADGDAGPTPAAGGRPVTRGQSIPPRVRPSSPAANTVVPPPAPAATAPLAPPPPAALATPPAADQAFGEIPLAPTNEVSDITYDISMPLDEFIYTVYAPLVGKTALPAPNLPMTTTIALKTQTKLTKSQAIQALETVLGMNGIAIVPIPGGLFFKVVPEANAPRVGGTAVTNSAETLPDSGSFITEIVQLKYADPEQVVKALSLFAKSADSIIYIQSTQSLILRDYTENVKRMLELLEKIDVSSPLLIKPRVINIRYALAADIANALTQLGAGGGSFGHSSTGAGGSAFGASSRGSFGSGGTGGAGGNSPFGGGVPGQSTQGGLSSGAAGGRSSNFSSALRSAVSSAGSASGNAVPVFGQVKIIADERTNSLLIFANDDDMEMITNIISKLDVPLKQVLIEAVILEVNLQDGHSLGVSYLQPQLSSGNLSGAGGVNNIVNGATSSLLSSGGSSSNSGAALLPSLAPGFSYFGKYGNNLDAVLEAAATDSRITVLSRPRIQTSHGVEADLFIGNTVPYVTGTVNYGYGAGPSSQYTQLEVGITLKVTPLINSDGLVVMDIDQEVEQLGPDVQIAGVGGVPTTTKRDAGTKVEVYSGDTIILGGFISASRSKSYSGVPGLMDIPVLGYLFKSATIQNNRTELIILMRPTVLSDAKIAAEVAMEETKKMSAVELSEVDLRKDEEARNEKASEELRKLDEKDAKRHHVFTNAPVDLKLKGTLANTNSASQSMDEQP